MNNERGRADAVAKKQASVCERDNTARPVYCTSIRNPVESEGSSKGGTVQYTKTSIKTGVFLFSPSRQSIDWNASIRWWMLSEHSDPTTWPSIEWFSYCIVILAGVVLTTSIFSTLLVYSRRCDPGRVPTQARPPPTWRARTGSGRPCRKRAPWYGSKITGGVADGPPPACRSPARRWHSSGGMWCLCICTRFVCTAGVPQAKFGNISSTHLFGKVCKNTSHIVRGTRYTPIRALLALQGNKLSTVKCWDLVR